MSTKLPTALTQVPFLDLKAQYRSIRHEVDRAMQEVVDAAAFAGGPFVERFEEQFARFCGCRYAAGVGSGTEALWLALAALGIGAGDEVITVADTFIATVEAILFCGAIPVLVDVQEDTRTMDPARLEEAITPNTRAVIPVHLYGQPADMKAILRIAERHGLFVVEDACQAHGARHEGRPVGSLGHAGCFSFYPGKNLGAYGEAGAVVTSDQRLDQRIRRLRDHGQSSKYVHTMPGWNGRMDGIQAAVLSAKLPHLDSWNAARREKASRYRELFAGIEEVILPGEAGYARHVYHVYALRVKRRDGLLGYLREAGIGCGIHYPTPIHLQEAFAGRPLARGPLEVTERHSGQLISLPMYPELTGEQQEYVVERVAAYYRNNGGAEGSRRSG